MKQEKMNSTSEKCGTPLSTQTYISWEDQEGRKEQINI